MATTQPILNKQRYLLRQTQRHRGGQISRLAEVDEVFQGEGKGNGLGEGNRDILLGLFDVGVLTDGHRAAANVTLAGELNAFLGSLNDD